MPKESKLQSRLCSHISEQEVNADIVTMNSKSLTFTIRHAESIENLNVIHSNVSPALSIHQTFDHHLEKNHRVSFWLLCLERPNGWSTSLVVNVQTSHSLKGGPIYLIGFVGAWHKDTTFPPAVALVATDRPQQDVSRSVNCLFALFDVQCADVRSEHVVPKGHTQV